MSDFVSIDKAYSVKYERIIHIADLETDERGKKGYFCTGCKEEVIARIGEKMPRHFAHLAKDITQPERECTWSNESFRHKVAKDILQILKKIKLPSVYSKWVNPVTGRKKLIQKSNSLEAAKVLVERQFYEDEYGKIGFGKKAEFDESSDKHLLVRPDIVFLDSNDKPILLIELVATHDIDDEKLAKINMLGINTISVKIPSGSKEDIEAVFHKTAHTKWVFNNLQESYEEEFSKTSLTSRKSVSANDDVQENTDGGGLPFGCRKNLINNLIRGFRKYISTGDYRRAKEYLRSEIQRVEENTERERAGYQTLIQQEEQKLGDLEIRYLSKRSELETKDKFFDSKFQAEVDRYRKVLDSNKGLRSRFAGGFTGVREEQDRIREAKEQVRRAKNELAREFEEAEKQEREAIEGIRRDTAELRQLIAVTERRRKEIDNRRKTLVEEYRELEKREESNYKIRRRHLQETFEGDRGRVADEFEGRRAKVREQFQKLRDELYESLDPETITELSSKSTRYRGLFGVQKLLIALKETDSCIKRIKKARGIIESGAYKDWF